MISHSLFCLPFRSHYSAVSLNRKCISTAVRIREVAMTLMITSGVVTACSSPTFCAN